MNSHGILMSGEMVRAWLAGWKGQTRRTRGLDEINEEPDAWTFENYVMGKALFHRTGTAQTVSVRPPYGAPGDELWFKETWKMWERDEDGRDFLHFRADDAKVDPVWWTEEDWIGPDPKWHTRTAFEQWQSSMLMPKICSRIRLYITGVRIERLNQISLADVLDEGISLRSDETFSEAVCTYFALWDKLNGKKFPASKNPWVWVYEFTKRQVRNG